MMKMELEKKHFELESMISNLRESPLFITIFQIASVWIVSDLSFEIVKNALDGNLTYNNNPLVITLYYLFWIFVSLSSFWNIYIKWQFFKNEIVTYASVLVVIGFIVTYLIYILPLFPAVVWTAGWKPPSELAFASGWYFLPKSAEIILQQLLISALAFSFINAKYSIKTTCTWCSILFGSAHLLLVFGGPSLTYISFFTFSATIAGFIFPYLILKTKNGFIHSYMLHWTFYAVVVVMAHIVFKI